MLDYLGAALKGGAGDDGLVQRFQLAVYPDVSRRWRNVDRWPDTQARQRAWEVFQKRTPKFVERWGARWAEVEAIPATDLRQMVREAIERHIPTGQWERLQYVEQLEREQWQCLMSRFASR
jgi:putative DNA primase/helicase